jgi:antagonist of KipI
VSQLTVIAAGMSTTVQDVGRWGYQAGGVSVAGPMDAYAHRLANLLVGNSDAEATLEMTLVGPELECEEERLIAVTGAEFDMKIGATPVPSYRAVVLPRRARLRCGSRRWGARSYLAVAGGIDVPTVFGSRATHVSSGLGGLEGRALRSGDRLPLGPLWKRGAPGRSTSNRGPRAARAHGTSSRSGFAEIDFAWQVRDGHAAVRVLSGPQAPAFAEDALPKLQSARYLIDAWSDRMGYRLDGVPLVQTDTTEMISEATSIGAIQVPPSGQPIVLMADRQTTGGYRTLATVITADLGLLGQLAPGDSVSFTLCSRAEALAALMARERRMLAALSTESV